MSLIKKHKFYNNLRYKKSLVLALSFKRFVWRQSHTTRKKMTPRYGQI